MLAECARKSLVGARPAVAVVLLCVNLAWAQSVQRVDTQITEPYDANSTAVGAVETGTLAYDAGRESAPLRGITLRLLGEIAYDDNVFRTESNTMDDFFWRLQPSVVFDGDVGRHRYRLGYDGDYAKYFDFSSEDYDDHRVFGDISLDITRKIDLDLAGEMFWGHDPRGAIGTCIVCSATPDTWRFYSAGAELVVGRAISRAQLIPSIEFSGIRYTNNGQSDRDYDRQDYRLRGRWRFSPRFSVIGDGGYAIVDHVEPSNGLDRTEVDLLGGIGWEATAKTSGEVLIGMLFQDFDNPAQGSSTNFNWDARVFWEPKTYSKVTLFTSRRSEEDAAGGVGHFLADTFGAGWRHSFSRSLLLQTGIDYTIAKYSTGRRDDYVAFDIGVTQEITRWLDAGARYRYLNRRSNVAGIDYDDNVLFLNLTAHLQHAL